MRILRPQAITDDAVRYLHHRAQVGTLFVKHVVTLKSFSFDYGIAPLIAAALSP